MKVDAAGGLLVPDAPGNNRLDTLENLLAHPGIGLMSRIPGFDETLRVNGQAALSTAPQDIAACATERRAPRLVIRVEVQAAYLHGAKAFMRAQLWEPDAQVPRSTLLTAGQMISAQTGLPAAAESIEEMRRRFAQDL